MGIPFIPPLLIAPPLVVAGEEEALAAVVAAADPAAPPPALSEIILAGRLDSRKSRLYTLALGLRRVTPLLVAPGPRSPLSLPPSVNPPTPPPPPPPSPSLPSLPSSALSSGR